MREISVPDELALRRHTSRCLFYVMHGSAASGGSTHGPQRPKAPDLRGVWPAGNSCQRSIRFDGSGAPQHFLCSMPHAAPYRRASHAARSRIPVRHAAFVAASIYHMKRADPLSSVPTTRWLPAQLRPTHAVRMDRANARFSARIGHQVLPQWRVSRCVRSRSPTSWRYGAIHQDVSCTSCTARPPPGGAVTGLGAQKRPI